MARILLIDDDPATRALVTNLLRVRGHALVDAAAVPELVLCNASHPQAPAWAARGTGTNMDTNTAAVRLLLVGAGDTAACERLLEQGFDGYIGLPLETGSFADEVEAFLPADEAAPAPALLLVDDDPFMLGMLEDVVRGQGWRVLTAASGEEAVALLARESAAVVLSDQRMPGMSGAELLAQVRARQPASVRLLLSGQREDAAIDEALRRGDAERFHAKPWNGAALLAGLHEAFRLHRTRAGV